MHNSYPTDGGPLEQRTKVLIGTAVPTVSFALAGGIPWGMGLAAIGTPFYAVAIFAVVIAGLCLAVFCVIALFFDRFEGKVGTTQVVELSSARNSGSPLGSSPTIGSPTQQETARTTAPATPVGSPPLRKIYGAAIPLSSLPPEALTSASPDDEQAILSPLPRLLTEVKFNPRLFRDAMVLPPPAKADAEISPTRVILGVNSRRASNGPSTARSHSEAKRGTSPSARESKTGTPASDRVPSPRSNGEPESIPPSPEERPAAPVQKSPAKGEPRPVQLQRRSFDSKSTPTPTPSPLMLERPWAPSSPPRLLLERPLAPPSPSKLHLPPSAAVTAGDIPGVVSAPKSPAADDSLAPYHSPPPTP